MIDDLDDEAMGAIFEAAGPCPKWLSVVIFLTVLIVMVGGFVWFCSKVAE